jgi:hypothetical protein
MTALFSRDPIFAQTLAEFQVSITAAKTTRAGVANATLLILAPAEGLWLTRLWLRYGDTLATALRADLYISPDGSAALPVDSVLTGTPTVSATVDIPEVQFLKWSSDTPLYLAPGHGLWGALSTTFAAGMVFCGQGQVFTSPATASIATA